MFYYYFDTMLRQTPTDDLGGQDFVETDRPNLLDRFLTAMAWALFPQLMAVDARSGGADSEQPEADPADFDEAFLSERYVLDPYWLDLYWY